MNSTAPQNESNADEPAPEFRNYRSPQEDGQSFVQPDLGDAGQLIRDNQSILETHGAEWQSLRTSGRKQLLADALRYTSAYRNVDWASSRQDASIIMAGHQPTLFHPGVWFKNFALSHLGERNQAIAINLVVDNDVASGSSIRVPTIDAHTGLATYRHVPYDQAGGGRPHEQTSIDDRELFDHFDSAVAAAVRPLVPDPCVDVLWQHARAAIDRCGVAGCALAQARHALEADIGLQTLEVPLGAVCRGEAFAMFVSRILCELPRFQDCYNDSADIYRRAHHIRSSAHPVANLAAQDGWLEAPLWIYGNRSPTRRAAWIQMHADHLLISDLLEREIRIETSDLASAASQLREAQNPEFKLRPRALLTTMYARSVLSDLFLHGIGGAKYDQLGDMIAKSFFGITPPQFMVTSATVLLPGVQSTSHAPRIAALKRQIRETLFQGERFASELSQQLELVNRKRQLLSEIPPRGQRTDWHIEITRVNARLADALHDTRADLLNQLSNARQQAASQSVLESREHPFCVYPLEHLVQSFQRLLDH